MPCSAGEPLAMRLVVGSDKHQPPGRGFSEVCGSKAARSYKEAALG